MRKIVAGVCCLLVGMQILVGVPLAVCLAFFLVVHGGGDAPMAIEVHAGRQAAATIPPVDYPPPPNVIPSAIALDHPIMQSRCEHGSPLSGTVMAECAAPGEEEELFVSALEKVVAESPLATVCANEVCAENRGEKRAIVPQLTVHLYAMAEIDEQAGEFERADQWRGLARELRKN